jgi:signal transduction histidine kinase
MATLLVVDDNPSIRRLLSTLLGRVGHRVLEAGDGAEALESVRINHPDLVIADVLMPTMDGYELVRQIRSDPLIASLPVIFFTAVYHENEARRLAKSCGVQHVITKPSDRDAILKAVNAALGTTPQQPAAIQVDVFDREHRRLLTDKLSEKSNELEMTNLRLQALVEAGRSLATERDPAQLLNHLCGAARTIVGARHCIAGILARGGRSFQYIQTSGVDQAGRVSLYEVPLDCGVLTRLLAGESPLRFKDLASDPIAQSLPAPHGIERSFLGVAIRSPGVPYGVLCMSEKLGADEFSEEDSRIASALAAQAAVAWENILRDEELRNSAEQLRRLAADLRLTREQERALLAREVHEGVGQRLTELKMELSELMRAIQARAAPEELRRHSVWMLDVVERTSDAVQKISGDLRPALLDMGLVEAIEWHAREFQTRFGIRCTLEAPRDISLDAERSVEVFRIIQEILTNAALHSGANTTQISILEQDDHYLIEAHDDGIGILPQEVADSKSLGLLAMRERARTLGGEIEIAGNLGRGTTVRLKLPRAAPQKVSGLGR